MSKNSGNEKIKLLANWMNAASVTVLGAGGLLPLLSVYAGVGTPMREPAFAWQLLIICSLIAAVLHWGGSLYLGRMSDD
jgi:hypothetical protein